MRAGARVGSGFSLSPRLEKRQGRAVEEDLEASYLQPFLPSWSLQKGTQGHPEVLSGVPLRSWHISVFAPLTLEWPLNSLQCAPGHSQLRSDEARQPKVRYHPVPHSSSSKKDTATPLLAHSGLDGDRRWGGVLAGGGAHILWQIRA